MIAAVAGTTPKKKQSDQLGGRRHRPDHQYAIDYLSPWSLEVRFVDDSALWKSAMNVTVWTSADRGDRR